MSHESCTDNNAAVQAGSSLASGYDELTRVDQALRDAERRLDQAHRDCAGQLGPRQATEVYREVLSLRDRSRQVLSELAEIWVADR